MTFSLGREFFFIAIPGVADDPGHPDACHAFLWLLIKLNMNNSSGRLASMAASAQPFQIM